MQPASLDNAYESKSKLSSNGWITDPRVEDPENLPEPLGWHLLIRPYPVVANQKRLSGLIVPGSEVDFLNYVTNIGRVVAVGPACWNRSEHKYDGQHRVPWVKVGDFVSFPKNVGAKRKFKGVSFMILMDDEVVERLPDPQVFNDAYYMIDIPDEHMLKYNTYRKETK